VAQIPIVERPVCTGSTGDNHTLRADTLVCAVSLFSLYCVSHFFSSNIYIYIIFECIGCLPRDWKLQFKVCPFCVTISKHLEECALSLMVIKSWCLKNIVQ